MQQCYSHITEEDMDHMFLQAPEVIHMIRADGRVKDVLLDELGICKLQGNMHINRDDLVTWRQHAHVLSHASKEKFVDYLLMRNERNDPALQQQRKLQEQTAKVIQRAAAAQEKAEKVIREKANKRKEGSGRKRKKEHTLCSRQEY